MIKLSAIIITLNEERNIERCLTSLRNIADEIIVLDSFSSDNTELICKKFDVKFVKRKWEGYSKTKNFANALAKNNFILSLDADEEISEELK
ncbi:MAG: glycosyltransferase family 2 protein, partial [Bacteroidota bacterium]